MSSIYPNSKVDYIHKWLKRKYGKALSCENPKCKGISRNYYWALKKNHVHAKQRKNYMWLCASCHITYDFNEEWRNNLTKNSYLGNHRGHSWNKGLVWGKDNPAKRPEVRKKISEGIKRWWSIHRKVNQLNSNKHEKK